MVCDSIFDGSEFMKYLFCLLAIASLSACGSSGGSKTPVNNSIVIPGPGASPTPTPTPSPTPVQMTYYSQSQTVNNASGVIGNNYTVYGACVQYSGSTYCWDDGIKSNTFNIAGNMDTFTYDFWGIDIRNGLFDANCSGGCGIDPMTNTPSIISVGMASSIGSAKINNIFIAGTPHIVECTLTASVLNCVDFSVNLSQQPLD
jgi:hypothetical protein